MPVNDDAFFESPILNSPYECPSRHWETDESNRPTGRIVERRRPSSQCSPIPKATTKAREAEGDLFLFQQQQSQAAEDGVFYEENALINHVRDQVTEWRAKPERDWNVTPETARLLRHWRTFKFASYRPFFCQLEAVETLIWLIEVAPSTKKGKELLDQVVQANADANPNLYRMALKLATGAGKTTVMAMIIAWQTVNAYYHPQSRRFTNGFLVCTPGITIRDRLRVLRPSDPDAYYKERQLVPEDFLQVLARAKVVITNYHAFKRRALAELPKETRALLADASGSAFEETEAQMLRRVMPELVGIGRVLILNDEAHHCYRRRPEGDEERELDRAEKKDAEDNEKIARLWASGLEAVRKFIDPNALTVDLSATPFFLRGSGYQEGTLFPWTVSDFSLMDALECGIVKLPRIPILDDATQSHEELPFYRNLWKHIGKDTLKARSVGDLPPRLRSAIHLLYGHYVRTFEAWEKARCDVPPCFVFVCQNTTIAKLVCDLVAGYTEKDDNGDESVVDPICPLFGNYDPATHEPLARPHTLLIDSTQLESGDVLSKDFRQAAAREIEAFKRDLVTRTGDRAAAESLTEEDLLREVMNTVGKAGRLGADIRCVVSVSMLTEGWDANNVTHILGVRAFGTQLLCEQVVGRALRRQSYAQNPATRLFTPEYADIFGVPFDFVAKGVAPGPVHPPEMERVQAVRPDRDELEIRFPRVRGYSLERTVQFRQCSAAFTANSRLTLKPEDLGPGETVTGGIAGARGNMNIGQGLPDKRPSSVIAELTNAVVADFNHQYTFVDKARLFGNLKPIVMKWYNECLSCEGSCRKQQILYPGMLRRAVERIKDAIITELVSADPDNRIRVSVDTYYPEGSSASVNFFVSKKRENVHRTAENKSHVNFAVCDSEWEVACCRMLEEHPRVLAYVRNAGLNFEVPYTSGGEKHVYLPDFIVLADDGHGPDDPLHLVIEVKGEATLLDDEKEATLRDRWIPGVNAEERFGRWACARLDDVNSFREQFDAAFAAPAPV